MKLSHNFFCLLLVVLVCLLAVFQTTEARRKGKKSKAGVCKYARKGEEGPCDTATNMKTITLQLRRGDPATCSPTKEVQTTCDDNSQSKKKKVKGCKYERKGADWTECDEATGMKTKVMNLREGSNAECPPTRTKTKACGKKGKRGGRRSRKVSDA